MWNVVTMNDGKRYLADVTNDHDGTRFITGYTSSQTLSDTISIRAVSGDLIFPVCSCITSPAATTARIPLTWISSEKRKIRNGDMTSYMTWEVVLI